MPSILEQHLDLETLHEKPVVQKEKVQPKPQKPVQEIAEKWIAEFNEAIKTKNSEAIADLFLEDGSSVLDGLLIVGWWRDVLALSWDFHTYHSRNGIKQMIERNNTDEVGLSNFALDPAVPVALQNPGGSPEFGDCITAFFTFETNVGRGKGVFRLMPADNQGNEWKAYTLFTSLQELKGCEERKGRSRPKGVEHGEHGNRKIWFEDRTKMQNMEGWDPTVLVIGSGHSGLNIAARLGMLDMPTLVIDKNERVGDNWRKRYKTYVPRILGVDDYRLVLHDPVWYDHLAYIPFPPHWPIFTPKGILSLHPR